MQPDNPNYQPFVDMDEHFNFMNEATDLVLKYVDNIVTVHNAKFEPDNMKK